MEELLKMLKEKGLDLAALEGFDESSFSDIIKGYVEKQSGNDEVKNLKIRLAKALKQRDDAYTEIETLKTDDGTSEDDPEKKGNKMELPEEVKAALKLVEELKADKDKSTRESLIKSALKEENLPEVLINRITGTDAESIKSDVAALKQSFIDLGFTQQSEPGGAGNGKSVSIDLIKEATELHNNAGSPDSGIGMKQLNINKE